MALCIGRDADLMADVLGNAAITLRRWKQDPLQSGARNPIDVLEILIQTSLDSGRDKSEALAPLDYLVRRFAKESAPSSDISIHAALADVTLEEAHLTSEYSIAIRDGHISPDERRKLQREVGHLHERLENMINVLQSLERTE